MSMSLQARKIGLADRHMGGFDKSNAVQILAITPAFQPLCVVALGKQGAIEQLNEYDQSREQPNSRMETSKLAKNTFDF